MIVMFRFDMNDEDDVHRFNEVNDARAMAIAIGDAKDFIRSKLKHGNVSEETAKVLEDLRDIMNEELVGCKTEF